jgi:hypothetical protein
MKIKGQDLGSYQPVSDELVLAACGVANPIVAEKDVLASGWWLPRTFMKTSQRPLLAPESCDYKR